MRRLVLVLLMGCLHPLLATSAVTPGKVLLDKCSVFVDMRDVNKLSEEDKSAIDWCAGYIQAVVDPIRAKARTMNSGQPTQYMEADGLCQYGAGEALPWDLQHAIYIVVKYLRDYPAKQQLAAYAVITEALKKEYPCH